MRVSKYKQLEGQTFNVKGSSVKVVRYHRELKVSKKTGKIYYAYRLDVQLEGYTDILDISTSSWNKQSFIKRLIKTSVNKEVKVNEVSTIYVDDDDREKFNYDVLASIVVNIIKPEPIKEVKPKPVKPTKPIEDVMFDPLDETRFNKMKESKLEEIDKNNNIRHEWLFVERIDKPEVLAEAKRNGFETYEDYINWYFDKENEEEIELYYIMNERHDELRFRYNLQGYFDEVLDIAGFQGLNKGFRKLAKQYHPDMGGNELEMEILIEEKNRAVKEYKEALQQSYDFLAEHMDDKTVLIEFLKLDKVQFNDMIKFGIIGDDLLKVVPNVA